MGESRSLRMHVDLSHWEGGFEHLSAHGIPEAAVKEWDQAVEILFGATQTYAHVLSGDMVSTGRYDTKAHGMEVVGEVVYGGERGPSGEMVDYVQYELRRKGSHDFYARAVRKTQSRLEEGASKMVRAAFDEAFGRL